MSLTVKQINAKSEALGKQTKNIQEAIHNHAIVIAQHIAEHGDVTIADTLVEALGKSLRSNALRQWFLDFGGCMWNDKKKKFGKKKDFTLDVGAATANPFWEYVPEAAFKPIDGNALLAAALKKMKAALEDTDHAGQHKVDAKMVRALEAIMAGDFAFGDEVDGAEEVEQAA